ncbi:MAG: ubiquinone biosynthesis accessory factor UbiJ, partial [Gammaproteobacteria bacterium]
PDVTLEGQVKDFVAFIRAHHAALGVPPSQLQIQGDLATAQLVQALLDDLSIDWEELLAHYLGDIAAHQVGRGIRHGLQWLSQARAAWAEDLNAYVVDETRLLPNGREVAQLAQASTTLVEEVDRLAARVERLLQRRKPDVG